MTELRRGDFRDPAVICEERQNGSCIGCKSLTYASVFGVDYVACKIDKEKWARDVWQLRKCGLYEWGGK
jgi:hypothetical protein